MTTLRMGARIARQLQTTERTVDHAMAAASALIQAMIEGRLEANLAAEVGHAQLTDAVGALNRLADARTLVVRSHGGLGEVAETLGVAWRMEGPYEEKIRPTPLVPVPAAAAG